MSTPNCRVLGGASVDVLLLRGLAGRSETDGEPADIKLSLATMEASRGSVPSSLDSLSLQIIELCAG